MDVTQFVYSPTEAHLGGFNMELLQIKLLQRFIYSYFIDEHELTSLE